MRSLFSALVVAALLTATAAAVQTTTQIQTLTADETKEHVGETATVCGKVVSTRYAASSRSRPTFLNFDQPYPDHIFTIVIWGTDRAKFDRPEEKYRDKRACVSGRIATYRGVPQIVATQPAQLRFEREDPQQSDDR